MKEKISALLVLLVLPQLLFATIIRIPYDYLKIQEGIDAAVNGDTVWVDLGTYFEGINFRGKNILVTSNYIFDHDRQTIDNTVIDGFYLHGQDTASVVCFVSGEDTSAVLNGFTIKRGQGTRTAPYDWYGGGIFCRNASPIISNNRIIENGFPAGGQSSHYGGGISVDETPCVKIVGNNISDNSVVAEGASGGGISCHSDSAVILNNVISSNSCFAFRLMFAGDAYGGGLCFAGQSIVLQGNTIENNTCQGTRSARGGGAYVWVDRSFLIEGNSINSNSITNQWGYGAIEGAGLVLEGYGEGTVSRNLLRDNYFGYGALYYTDGAGIYFYMDKVYFIRNSFVNNQGSGLSGAANTLLISRNVVWGDSLGIYCQNCAGGIENNTIYSTFGFGIKTYLAVNTGLQIRNNIIASTVDGPGIVSVGGYTPELYYNDVWNNAGGNYQGLEPGEFDIHEDPLFVDPERGDFRLTEESPCIDAGDPDPQYNDPDGSRNDIGAFWLGYTPVSEIEVEILPKEFTLFQNYPNPFNATTRITYQLVNPLPSKVTLEIHNLQGQRVRRLVDQVQPAGIYEVTWNGHTEDGGKISSGVYIYILSVDGNWTSKKMLFLK